MKSNFFPIVLIVGGLVALLWIGTRLFQPQPILATTANDIQRTADKTQAVTGKAVVAACGKGAKIILVHPPEPSAEGEARKELEAMKCFLDIMEDKNIEVVAKVFYPALPNSDTGNTVAVTQNLSAAWLAQLAGKHPDAKAIVSFSGLPVFPKDMRAEDFKGKLLPMVCVEGDMTKLADAMRAGIVLAAVAPRGGPPPKKLGDNWFDQIYMTVTPGNLDKWQANQAK